MTQNNRPDSADKFDDVNVPTYNADADNETTSFTAQPVTQYAGDENVHTSAVEPTGQVIADPGYIADEPRAPQGYTAPPTTITPDPAFQDQATEDELEAARLRGRLDERREEVRRGTIDFGLLLVRAALAVLLIISGITTFFSLGGADGLTGLQESFSGYDYGNILAIAVPTLQLIAGIFLLLGLVTPLFAMLALVVTGFTAIHEIANAKSGLDIFAWPEAIWLSIVLFVIAIAIQFTGPGVISLDFSRSWARRPLASSWVFIILGIAALVAIWFFLAGVNPLA
ncbi:hypothetical protein CPHO_07295 [Corynebacterium phocae]|uniref:DoxX family protein n=1 Tax=Corynebacterium phocae TaxID=161895 RepID=A0A1L7D3S8_9CORY|nr:DoxX family protein [Corynebacterium phocae]APT92727.1 hypothetical protein CPHO_07295 [Corynebacterium phocae]KAA8723035.1 DoxX family protein [Corynebacterium phocae]